MSACAWRKIAWLVAACVVHASAAAAPVVPLAKDGVFTVAAPQTVARSLRAYAQIESMAVVRIRAVAAGTLGGLRIVPGSVVAAGEVLAQIGGAGAHAVLTTREQALAKAQAQQQTAEHALQTAQELLRERLGTRQSVDSARSHLAAAQAAVRTAQADLVATRASQTVRAPATGIVLSRPASNGEAVTAGETLLTLQPDGQLWISARYYGADADLLRVGMEGSFQPAGDGAAIAVKVVAAAPGVTSRSGRRVGVEPVSAARPAWWTSGQWGTLTLAGPAASMVAVPTRALILDRGRWWVLVHTAGGDTPREVIPGPAQQWNTWIAAGLRAGEQVVVDDAYLKYHRGVDATYQPPD